MLKSPAGLTLLGLALASTLFVSVNSLSGRLLAPVSADLTDQGLYTLSPGTRSVLARIDEPVTLKFYYSNALGEAVPSYGVYAQRVRQLLQRYASLSGGKVRLEILDPTPFSDVEDQATAAGLQGVRAEEGGGQVYFGLVGTNSTDDEQTIPFFQADREKFLEYDLTKLVQTLAFPRKKVIGLITSLALEGDPMAEMRGQPSQPEAIIEALRETYDVHDIPPESTSIPDDVDVLMVVQPQKLSDKTEYAIDQFVLGGGHALVFVDPYSEFQKIHRSPMTPPGAGNAASFDRLLHAWGVDMPAGKIVGDRIAARRVNAGAPGAEPIPYLAWLELRGDDLNQSDPVTAKLGELNLATAGALEPVKGATTGFEPLIITSAASGFIDKAKVDAPLPDFDGILDSFKPEGKRFTLAARITGTANTAFPDGVPAEKKDPKDKTPPKPVADPHQLKTAKSPLNVIVVADTDMLDDRFWIDTQSFAGRKVAEPFANNGDFVLNALDSLAGSDELITLRARGSSQRPFTLVDQIKRDAEEHYRAHEKELQTKLRDTQEKLATIKPQDDGSGEVQLTADQAKAVEQFRTQIVSTRAELRQVQLKLRESIDALKNRLVLEDVGLVPAAVAGIALLLGWLRARRRQRRAPAN
jgi:ABC-type uncharacterized transport system involved in gliding motility auxiliary subunit